MLQDKCGLTAQMSIADVASGTGIFTRLLLENGNHVFGVEPNEKMRLAGEEYLAEFPNFVSVSGTAEATALPDHSVQMITCAQAAHWLKHEEALREFQRILEPSHYVVLIFNDRQVKGDAFANEYEELVVSYGTDYSAVQRTNSSRHTSARSGRCRTIRTLNMRRSKGDCFRLRMRPRRATLDTSQCWRTCAGSSRNIKAGDVFACAMTRIFTLASCLDREKT